LPRGSGVAKIPLIQFALDSVIETVPGTSGQSLFSINLRTGAATKIGDLGGGRTFSDIAIRPA